MQVARTEPNRRRGLGPAGLYLGVLLVAGCVAASPRPAFDPQESAPETIPGDVAESPPEAESPASDAGHAAPSLPSAPVLDAEVQLWNGKPLVVVRTEVPAPRWRAVLLPLPVTEEHAREYRLVLIAPVDPETTPSSTNPPAPTEQTVLSSENLPPEVEQVVIYGADDVLVIPTR